MKHKVGARLLEKIVNRKIAPSKDLKIVEGIKNVYYETNYLKRNSGEYSSINRSWYFFPWNKDEIGIFELVQPIFNNVLLLNNQDLLKTISNTPSKGVVERLHLINYPINSGQISLHRDPVNISQVNFGIYLSEFGVNYGDGGFYVLEGNNEIVYLDQQVRFCDMVLWFPGLPHGVSTITPTQLEHRTNGRYFLSMSLIESHHAKDRIPAVGVEIL